MKRKSKKSKFVRRHEIALVGIVLAVTLFFVYAENSPTAKAIAKGSALPDWASSWAGVPWDVENGETLITSDFQNGKLVVNAKSQYIYRWGYIWNPRQYQEIGNGWQQFEFPRTNSESWGINWSTSDVSTEVPLSSEEVLDGENYVLAYTCNQKNDRWYCGCLDENTCQRWQLQTFDAYTATGVAQDMSKVLSPDIPPEEKQAAQTRLNQKKVKGLALSSDVATETRADFDGNGIIDLGDFFNFAEAFDKKEGDEGYDSKYDLSSNKKVDFDDFFIFADNFGKTIVVKKPSSKILFTSRKYTGKLDYSESEKKILDISLQPSINNKDAYMLYILTTPEVSDISVVMYSESDKFYISRSRFSYSFTTNFFGKEIEDKKTGKLYVAEFDYSGLRKGSYNIQIDHSFGYATTFADVFDIIDLSDYDLSSSCVLIHKSKYPESESINLAFIGNTYSDEELPIYALDVDKSSFIFLNDPTIAPYKDRTNIYRANYASTEYGENLECRFDKDCIPILSGGFGIGKLLTRSEGTFCCNAKKVESEIKNLCGDRSYVMNVVGNEGRNVGTVIARNTIPPFTFLSDIMEAFRNYVLKRKETGITAQTRADPTTFSHEIGHLVAGLPDYYTDDASCKNHRCKMCSSQYRYSDQGLCFDKQGMVKWLNQWCKAEVKIFKDKNIFNEFNSGVTPRISPYPNPFNPTSSDTRYVNATVEFNVKYAEGEDPCYVLMNVYNINGQLVDMLVSKNPVPDGNSALKWDGTDMLDRKKVASGVYIYEVSIGDSKDTVKGTVVK